MTVIEVEWQATPEVTGPTLPAVTAIVATPVNVATLYLVAVDPATVDLTALDVGLITNDFAIADASAAFTHAWGTNWANAPTFASTDDFGVGRAAARWCDCAVSAATASAADLGAAATGGCDGRAAAFTATAASSAADFGSASAAARWCCGASAATTASFATTVGCCDHGRGEHGCTKQACAEYLEEFRHG